jgi:malate synthase
VAGTRAAVRTTIRYRNGVLNGRGASLLDGYMEDLATDRIYRLMIAQRMRHRDAVEITGDNGRPAPHTPEFVTARFDEELSRLLAERERLREAGDERTLREARERSEAMIRRGWFNPV